MNKNLKIFGRDQTSGDPLQVFQLLPFSKSGDQLLGEVLLFDEPAGVVIGIVLERDVVVERLGHHVRTRDDEFSQVGRQLVGHLQELGRRDLGCFHQTLPDFPDGFAVVFVLNLIQFKIKPMLEGAKAPKRAIATHS